MLFAPLRIVRLLEKGVSGVLSSRDKISSLSTHMSQKVKDALGVLLGAICEQTVGCDVADSDDEDNAELDGVPLQYNHEFTTALLYSCVQGLQAMLDEYSVRKAL